MIAIERITAGWLLDGLQLVNATLAPPSGYEFRGLMLEPGLDPIPQLGQIFRAPPQCLAFEAALREAIADRSLYRHEKDFAHRVMLGLVRLLDYAGSPEATLHLLAKLERREFDGADPYLIERVAAVGARQAERLRTRFEDALKAADANTWQPNLILPFLRTDIDLTPANWPAVAVARERDLRLLKDADSTNGLALVLGALCRDGRSKEVLTGLARFDPHREKSAFQLLFDRSTAESIIIPEPDDVQHFGDDSPVYLTVNSYKHNMTLGALQSLREPMPAGKGIAAQIAHAEKAALWRDAFIAMSDVPVQKLAAAA